MTQSGGNFLDDLLRGYKTVQSNGAVMPAEPTINFIGATVVDDPSNSRTNITVSANPNAVSGTGFWHSTSGTLDGAAKLVNLSTDTTSVLHLTSIAQDGAGTGFVLAWTGTQWAGTSNVTTGPSGITHGTAGQILVTDATPVTAWTSLIKYETTHGRFTSGNGGTDHAVTIGPLVGAETNSSAIWMLGNGVSASNTNMTLYADGSTFVGFNSPASFNWVTTGSTNIGQLKTVAGSQVSLWLGSGAAFGPGNVAFTSDASTFTNLNFPSGGALGVTFNNATYVTYTTATDIFFGGTNTAAPALVDWTTATTPIIQGGTASTQLTVGTNKSAATLVLQADAATTMQTLSSTGTEFAKAITLDQQTAPSAPAAGKYTIYMDSGDSRLKSISSAGTITIFPS